MTISKRITSEIPKWITGPIIKEIAEEIWKKKSEKFLR